MKEVLLPARVQNEIIELDALLTANDIEVTNKATSIHAGHALQEVKGWQKKLDTTRKSMTKPLDEKKKDIMAFFKPYTEKLEALEAKLKASILAWDEKERARLAAEQAELDAFAKAEEEKRRAELLEKAKEAADDWDVETAEELEQQAETVRVAVPVLTDSRTLAHGLNTYELYRWEITDLAALPRELMIPDEKKLNEIARRSKGAQDDIPGVRFFVETKLRSQAA